MTRQRLPNRRGALAFEFLHHDQRFRAQLGYHQGGGLAEVFLDTTRPDSALDAVAADAAILISLLLQRGSTPAEIGHALRRTPDGSPASLIGAVVDRLNSMGGQS